MTTYDELKNRHRAGEVVVDFRGHFGHGEIPLLPSTDDPPRLIREIFDKYLVQHALQRWGGEREGEETLPKYLVDKRGVCSHCGEQIVYALSPDGRRIDVLTRELSRDIDARFEEEREGERYERACPYPDGYPEYGPIVHFPTGECVSGDSLYAWGEDAPTSNMIGPRWAREITEKMGELGIASAYCGNTSPGIFRTKAGNALAIGQGRPGGGYTEIGEVCTDRWWWTIADKQVWEEVGERLGLERRRPHSEFRIKPGYWRVVSRHHRTNDDERTPVYARMQYLGEKHPVTCTDGVPGYQSNPWQVQWSPALVRQLEDHMVGRALRLTKCVEDKIQTRYEREATLKALRPDQRRRASLFFEIQDDEPKVLLGEPFDDRDDPRFAKCLWWVEVTVAKHSLLLFAMPDEGWYQCTMHGKFVTEELGQNLLAHLKKTEDRKGGGEDDAALIVLTWLDLILDEARKA